MLTFLDSSALVKSYVIEQGRDRVEAARAGASDLLVSAIALPEVVSALARRRRAGDIETGAYDVAKSRFLAHMAEATLIRLTDAVLGRAIDVLEAWPVRGGDAVHIACAIEWKCDLFVSADQRQLKAAKGCGLRVLDVSSD